MMYVSREKELLVTGFSYPSRVDRWFWLIPLIAACLLMVLQIVSIAVSYSGMAGILVPQSQDYTVFLLLLASVVFSVFLLKKRRSAVVQALPASIIVSGGGALGILLGSLFNTPLGLMLILGAFGPVLGLMSRLSDPSLPGTPTLLDIGLVAFCVLLSCLLYALLAFLVVRRTRSRDYGVYAALLAAFTATLMICVTTALISFMPVFTGTSDIPLINYLIGCKGLLADALLLGISQVVHAVIGALIGGAIASRADARRCFL